ncbi:MAG: Ig-like domain-containing protein [Myxococcales bacterium]
MAQLSATTTVTIHVNETAPIAANDAFTIGHGRLLNRSILTNDSDAESDPLTIQLLDWQTQQPITPQALAQSMAGTFVWNANGTFQYTAPQNAATEHFAYRLNDGLNNSSIATVTIQSTRTAPNVVADNFTDVHDRSLSASVVTNDSDVDGDSLTAQLYDPATQQVVTADQLGLQGRLTWSSNGAFVYAPPLHWTGTEVFRYRLFDGFDYSSPVAVTITVGDLPPTSQDDTYHVKPGTSYYAPPQFNPYRPQPLANDTDPDNDPLQVATVIGPTHGTLTILPSGAFTYTPTSGFRGTDSFTYRATDGVTLTNPTTATFLVANAPPVASNDQLTAQAEIPSSLSLVFNDTDPDGDALTAYPVDPVTGNQISPASLDLHGTLAWDSLGGFTYQANAGYSGIVTFSYRITDGWDISNTAKVTIQVQGSSAVNHSPVAHDDKFALGLGHVLNVPSYQNWHGSSNALPLQLNDSDADGDDLTTLLMTGVSHGSLALSADGSFVYTPQAGFQGTDQFTYQLFDGNANSNTATVTINVANHLPVAAAATFTVTHDQTLDTSTGNAAIVGGLSSTLSDVDTDTLTYSITANTTHGQLTLLTGGNFRYQPTPGYVGGDSFTYQIADGHGGTATAKVAFAVVNQRPTANSGLVTMTHDTTLTSHLPSGFSTDGDPIDARPAGGPFYGSLTLSADGTYVYTPSASFVGTDSFTYVWRDRVGLTGVAEGLESNFATITINVPRSVSSGGGRRVCFRFRARAELHGECAEQRSQR